MSSIIIELKKYEITKIGVDAIIDFYRTMATDQLQLPGLHAFATGVDSPSLNVVLDTRENAAFNSETTNSIASFFKKHQIPWGWFITTAVKTHDIDNHGFSLLYETPGMYFDLSTSLPEIKSDIAIIKEAHDDLNEWIQPLQEGFPSSDNCEAYRKLNANLLHQGEKKLRQFTAYCQNEAASSATLFLSDNSVMLHNLATKNKFRRRGIGAALTVHMMAEAKRLGYRHCFLDSSDDGFNVYSKLGFKVYCVTSVYEINKGNKS